MNDTEITKVLLLRRAISKIMILGIISKTTTYGLYEFTYLEGHLDQTKTVVTVEDLMKVNSI